MRSLLFLYKKTRSKRSGSSWDQSGGERGIRTLGRSFPLHTLSRRAPSAYSAISPLGNTQQSIRCIKRERLPPVNLAEGVGFEPTELLHSTVFKTAALNHSAIPPVSNRYFLPFHCFRVNDFIFQIYQRPGDRFQPLPQSCCRPEYPLSESPWKADSPGISESPVSGAVHRISDHSPFPQSG